MGKRKSDSVGDVTVGDVRRIRIMYDADQDGQARLHATVHLNDSSDNVSFYGADALLVAQLVTQIPAEKPVVETPDAATGEEQAKTE